MRPAPELLIKFISVRVIMSDMSVLAMMCRLSAKLEVGASSWRVPDLDGGEHLVLLAVVGLLLAEEDVALAAVLGVVAGQLAVELLFLPALVLLGLPPLGFLPLLGVFAEDDLALVVVLEV